MTDLIQILTEQGNSIVNEIKQNLSSTGTDATKKTSRSLRVEVKREGDSFFLRILGRPYFMTVETGRKPTPNKKPSKGMIDNIKDWLKSRGQEQGLAWAVATEINKKGSKLWQQGGRKDIVTNVIETKTEEIERAVLKQFVNMFVVNIKDSFK